MRIDLIAQSLKGLETVDPHSGNRLAAAARHEQNPANRLVAGALTSRRCPHRAGTARSRAPSTFAASRSSSPAALAASGSCSRGSSDAEGARIALAARDEGELERARVRISPSAASMPPHRLRRRQPRRTRERLVRDVVARTGRIDVLINNAGIIQVGPLDHMQRGDFEEAMAVHFWGPLHTMLDGDSGHETSGRRPHRQHLVDRREIGVPHLAPYCASKFALTGLSESMRAELAKDDIYVTTVCPGLMRTGSPFNAWFKGRHRDEFAWFAISDSMPLASIDASRAAAQVVDACRHGDAELVISWPAKLAVIANAIAPEAVALAMNLANPLVLPTTSDDAGSERHSGWQSLSDWAPSRLTRLTERAAAQNNELPQ